MKKVRRVINHGRKGKGGRGAIKCDIHGIRSSVDDVCRVICRIRVRNGDAGDAYGKEKVVSIEMKK